MALEARAVFKATAARAGGSRKLSLAMLVLVVLSFLVSPFFVDTLDRPPPMVRDGGVSYAGYGPLNAPVALKGEWRAQWLSGPTPNTTFRVKIPGPWENA